jgi:hypothetical protein
LNKVCRFTVVMLLVGLGGCKGMSLDSLIELSSNREPPTVEAALDRVNTAARIVEVGDLIMHTLPISGGSDWPRQVNGSVPFNERTTLEQKLRQDPAYYSGAHGQTSPLKLRALYLLTQLFDKHPDLHAPRRFSATPPSEKDVKELGARILGSGYPPAFTKVFYRFVLYYPDYEPKRSLFAGQLNGKATEVYPGLLAAITSLAENKDELRQISESVQQAEERKAKERRDIADLVQRIHTLEGLEYGNPTTAEEAVKAGERETHAKEIGDLKMQLEVAEKEFDATVQAYKDELQKLSIEMEKIKTQAMAFTPEQRALAANVQRAIDAVQETIVESEALLGKAAWQFKTAYPAWKTEVKMIAQQRGPAGNERIRRVTQNLVTLPSNLSVLFTEVGVLTKEVKGYDDLFSARVTVDTSGGTAEGAGWWTGVSEWWLRLVQSPGR